MARVTPSIAGRPNLAFSCCSIRDTVAATLFLSINGLASRRIIGGFFGSISRYQPKIQRAASKFAASMVDSL
jgi:hypothetical protein